MAAINLRVCAKTGALVTDYEALNAGVKRFVGWKATPLGFEKCDGPVSVPMRAEYVSAVKDGDLVAADAETAAICGVTFAAAPSAEKGSK